MLPFPAMIFHPIVPFRMFQLRCWRSEEKILNASGAAYLTFTDNLCAAPVALGLYAGVPNGRGDGGERNRCGAGVGMGLVHSGSSPLQRTDASSSPQRVMPAAVSPSSLALALAGPRPEIGLRLTSSSTTDGYDSS